MTNSDQHGPQSRRERLKRQRAEQILEAAAAVFARKGFHQATIREIAELADVAEGTIYNYFADKRDLLAAMTRYVIAHSAGSALAQLKIDDDRAFLVAFLNDRFDFAGRNFDFIRALMAEVWTDQTFRAQYFRQVMTSLLDLLEGYLDARIKDGGLRPVNTHIVVRAMTGSFLIFLLFGEPGQDQPDVGIPREELAGELADFFLFGLQPHPEPTGGNAE
ncbi:MAG: TetR/AcrR family transcriptional regulator [Anaerolineae bacterium]|nr:TetR/AcrR family transcriptional regulator [Anaerolineae bacterium]